MGACKWSLCCCRDDVTGSMPEDFFPLTRVGGFDFHPDGRRGGLLDASV